VTGVLLVAAVLVTGGAGALARLGVDGMVSRRLSGAFPAGTLVVNGSGAFALGLVTGIGVSADVALVIDTGLIGAYTTFSTWMLETHRLTEDGRGGLAVWNIGGSVVVGVVLASAGWALGSVL
jgi:fluoride exporter